ncbi:formyltransferase family protein [Amylibacter sp.]|nr:formyltransferase family protein [Amylibacter sp.]
MMPRKLNCVLLGSVKSSEAALWALLKNENVDVTAVVGLRDSNFNTDFVDILEIAASKKKQFFSYNEIGERALIRFIKEKNVDLLFVVGWSKLISVQLITSAKLGTVGYHPAFLPQNRGRHPIIWSLVLGLSETASTFFLLEKYADCGPILNQKVLSIEHDDYAASLYAKLLKMIPEQIDDIIFSFMSGTMKPVAQDNIQANYLRKRSREDGLIDWRMATFSIYNLVRALSKPYPGAEMIHNGEYVKIWSVLKYSAEVAANIEPGKVIYLSPLGPIVKTGDGALCLTKMDPKLKLAVGDYL